MPTKMMFRAAGALVEGRRIAALAGVAQVQLDWALVAKRIRAEATDDWDDTVAVERSRRRASGWSGARASPHPVR